MNNELIVAVFDTAAHAEAAMRDLQQAGIPIADIEMHRAEGTTATTTHQARPQGFWASIFGGEPDHDTGVYDRSIEGGSTVVSIKVPEGVVARATEILELHHPIDIDERASGYALSSPGVGTGVGTAPIAGTSAAANASLQLSEENLAVGKRVVNRGGTRIRRFVVETPVAQDVTLHDERVVLDRRPVTDSRPVGAADFSDKTIEMTETAEELVVAKSARVYEEVGLRKEATDRTETVRDTLRREEVELERIPGSPTTDATVPAPRTPKI